MRLFSSVAETLCRLPASASHPGVSAGVSFTMQRSTVGFSERHVAWSLLAERAQEISHRCREIANDIDPSLAEVGERLEAVAARLARSDRMTPLPSQAASRTGSTVTKAAMNASAIEEARGENILLRFEGKRCIHARFCVLGAPNVFLANVKGSWLHPDAMPVEELVATAHACPSGAITYERLDGGAAESAPPVNVLRIRENGPLAIHADIDLAGHCRMFRATLCRCGGSRNKPFCDGSHVAPFIASGEPPERPSEPLANRRGRLLVTPLRNGPLEMSGSLEICSGTGRTVAHTSQVRLCRCGGSASKPFCDGTHARIGFKSDV
jgi:CDGSH-type Zn-finger protein/uncharacterized Fe-S cluster protein YjdI